MSAAGKPDYIPDHLYERLFQPWTLPESEWPLCKEDWARVDAITALPWEGRLLDFGSGDGTLSDMVLSRNPLVHWIDCVERDSAQVAKWCERHPDEDPDEYRQAFVPFLESETDEQYCGPYDGALCCEVLEHMTPDEGHKVLCDIKRVLKPGGMLCVTVPNQAGPRAIYPGHVREFTIAELGRTVTNAGFRVVNGDAIGGKIIPVWFMAVCRA